MKSLLLSVLIFMSAQSIAITWEVIEPCLDQPQFYGEYDQKDLDISVGDTTVAIFDKFEIPYLGNRIGIGSINMSPVGDEALEVISDDTMRSHGWCYSINGVVPEVYPSEIQFTSNDDHLTWFYCYALYEKGVWKSFYNYTNKIKPEQICSK